MADLETIERVKEIDVDKYKYGFQDGDRERTRPKGPVGRHRALYLCQEG